MRKVFFAGNFDSGKSTLIGRMLAETASLYQDEVERNLASSTRQELDFALFTDGLEIERREKSTLDISHRSLQWNHDRWQWIDCPGQNPLAARMLAGASVADIGIFVLDASRPEESFTPVQAALLSWLEIPNVLVAVNKLDLLGEGSQACFERIVNLSQKYFWPIQPQFFLPISAKEGKNISSRGYEWFSGPTLLEALSMSPSPASFSCALKVQRARGDKIWGQLLGGKICLGDNLFDTEGRFYKVIELEGGDLKEVISPCSPRVTLSLPFQSCIPCLLPQQPRVQSLIRASLWPLHGSLPEGPATLLNPIWGLQRGQVLASRWENFVWQCEIKLEQDVPVFPYRFGRRESVGRLRVANGDFAFIVED